MMYRANLKNRHLRPSAIATLLIAVLAASCGAPPDPYPPSTSLPPAPATADAEIEGALPEDAPPPESPTADAEGEQPAPSPETPTAVREQPAQVAQNAKRDTVQVYWLDANAQTVKLAPSTVTVQNKATAAPNSVLETAFEQLLSQPESEARASSIPEGTRLLGVSQQTDGVRVNLSEDFTKGGGTMSMTGRVAQVLYTATTLNPETKVWLEIEGQPLEVLGGEGLILDQPLTRQKFERDFNL
ncbi:MAG: GerMN domain-containing protein [Cyanobacteriota bacterium]|nr:GerMN domain-containing protein [Cyanobacteriota bacterium]